LKENQLQTHAENAQWLEASLKTLDDAVDFYTLPVWVQDVASLLPDWGFEIHCQRWVEGLDAALYSIKSETPYRTPFGRYGDFTGQALQTLERLANAVEGWIEGQSPEDETGCKVHETLGDRNPDKIQAGRCFVEITRTFAVEQGPTETFNTLGEVWRAKADENELLDLIFSGEGLDRGLLDGGGFWMEARLMTVLRLIGGAQSDTTDLLGSCNYQLRHVFRDDPARMQVTRGYLIGIAGYLNGDSIAGLRHAHPELAGYAIRAYTCLSGSKLNEPDKRWLAKKFYLTTRFWYVRALIFALEDEVGDDDRLLPEIEI